MGKLPRGFSLQINGGTAYAGFYARFTKMSWRFCFGWLAITLFFYDVEPAVTEMLKQKGVLPRKTDPKLGGSGNE